MAETTEQLKRWDQAIENLNRAIDESDWSEFILTESGLRAALEVLDIVTNDRIEQHYADT